MNARTIFSNKRISGYLNLLSAVLTIVIMIAYGITASSAKNFNKMVELYMAIAVIACVVYFLVGNVFADITNVVAVVFITMAIGTFAINSINTFADVLNGISMFGSSGGIGYIITLLILMAIVLVAELVSCFMSRDKKDVMKVVTAKIEKE